MTQTDAQSYRDWYTAGPFAPYVMQVRAGGDTLWAMEAAQPAGDMSDPPLSDLLLVRPLSRSMSGEADFGAGRFRATTGPGALFLAPVGVATQVEMHVPHCIRVFALSAARFGPVLAEVRTRGDPLDFGRLHAAPFASPAIVALADRLWVLARGEGASRLRAESAALAILGELVQLAQECRPTFRGGLTPRAARRCGDFLRAHLAEDVTITDLAAIAGLSPFHFARAFKTTMGLPPAAYQRRLRAAVAQELLQTTDLPVGEVAAAVGYETPQAFARMFRAEVGVSPSDWRREVRG